MSMRRYLHNYSHLELLDIFTGYLKVLSILAPQRCAMVELFMECSALQEEMRLLKHSHYVILVLNRTICDNSSPRVKCYVI